MLNIGQIRYPRVLAGTRDVDDAIGATSTMITLIFRCLKSV